MPELDELMKSSAAVMAQSVQNADNPINTVSAETVNTSAGTVVNPYTNASLLVSYNQNDNQLFTTFGQNSYKSDETNSLNDCQPTELTFSDLTPPVPNVSTLESNRLIAVDTSLPTVDGVSGAVPESKLILIQQMSSITSESIEPSIEIPTNETLVPSMAPKPEMMEVVTNNNVQYSNIFEPVINGPSGSAPQTPAASPIAAMEHQSITMTTDSESAQMPIMSAFENTTAFVNTTITTAAFNAAMDQMTAPVLSNPNMSTAASDGPLPVLGIEPALQEQLLDAIPPPSVNFPPGPMPTDESGIPTALPGEFPLSLLPVEEEKVGDIESASVPLDKIEATINMNAKPIPTLTNAVSLTQSEVNLIKSLPQTPQLIPAQQSSTAATNQLEATAEQQFNLNYSNQLQTTIDQLVYTSAPDVQQSQPPSEHSMSQIQQQTLQALQSQQRLAPKPLVQQQPIVNESQLPPAPAPPTATSITVFDTNPNELMPDIVSQNQMSNVLPPPPPLQPVQNSQPLPEMNTLTNLVPVVETSDQSLHQTSRQSISVVVKSEPMSYSESMSEHNIPDNTIGLSKVNDDNNNPILNNLNRDNKDSMNVNIRTSNLANNQVRGFPLCVISTTPTTFISKNSTTIVGPKYELTLPPKKAKFTTSGLASVAPQSKMSSQSHAVPSTGMLYDLTQQQQHISEHSSNNSQTFRVQSGLTPAPKLQHNMSAPFTTVSPILFSGLMPSVSVALDGPLALVKEEKMRQLITTTAIPPNHPDYPAISGLLSFINPYHKTMTTTSMTGHEISSETPLSLSVKNSLTQPVVTANTLSQSHSSAAHSSHVPSLSRPTLHHNQSITSATTLVQTQPTAVPVSVVTSVVDHNRGLTQRIKTIGQNNSKNKINVEQHHTTGTTGSSGVKLQLAPLLSGDPAKPFQCALCGKHLASKNVYQLHLRSHSGEKPFTCNLCGHSFSQKTSLTRHMRSHTGERPFPCQACGKRFADKERIKIHMRTHTGEKPFACDTCGKQFSQKSTVKRHMSVHTGEKPFKCETCGKGFANRGNLTAHTKTHSNS